MTTLPTTSKPARNRRSLADRVASGIDDAIESCARAVKVAAQWQTVLTDDDDRAMLALASEQCASAATVLAGASTYYRDLAPASAQVVEYHPGDFVRLRAKDMVTYKDAVENPASLLDMVVSKVSGAIVWCRTCDGEKVPLKRSQIEACDGSDSRPKPEPTSTVEACDMDASETVATYATEGDDVAAQ
jgi:hypothetical protein